MVKNLPFNLGYVGSIPVRGAKIPHAMEQVSPHSTTREKQLITDAVIYIYVCVCVCVCVYMYMYMKSLTSVYP